MKKLPLFAVATLAASLGFAGLAHAEEPPVFDACQAGFNSFAATEEEVVIDEDSSTPIDMRINQAVSFYLSNIEGCATELSGYALDIKQDSATSKYYFAVLDSSVTQTVIYPTSGNEVLQDLNIVTRGYSPSLPYQYTYRQKEAPAGASFSIEESTSNGSTKYKFAFSDDSTTKLAHGIAIQGMNEAITDPSASLVLRSDNSQIADVPVTIIGCDEVSGCGISFTIYTPGTYTLVSKTTETSTGSETTNTDTSTSTDPKPTEAKPTESNPADSKPAETKPAASTSDSSTTAAATTKPAASVTTPNTAGSTVTTTTKPSNLEEVDGVLSSTSIEGMPLGARAAVYADGNTNIPSDVKLKVKAQDPKSDAIAFAIRDNDDFIGAFDFTLTSSDGKTTYKDFGTAGLTVAISIDPKYKGAKNLYARYINDQGIATESDIPVNVICDGSDCEARFNVKHFSIYALIVTNSPLNNYNLGAVAPAQSNNANLASSVNGSSVAAPNTGAHAVNSESTAEASSIFAVLTAITLATATVWFARRATVAAENDAE